MRAVILARVSTKDRGQTVDQQEDALRSHAEKSGWDVVDVIRATQSAFKDESAHEVETLVFEKFKEGKADVVMVWAMDRWTRRGPAAALRLIHELENHYKGHFFSLQEPFLSTATMDPLVRELMLSLMGWMAKQESHRKSERILAKVQHKKQAAAKLGKRAKWASGKMLMDEEKVEIRSLAGKMSQRALAKKFDCSVGTINKVLNE